MRFKKYYKDIISLIASLSLLAMVYFMNHYDIKQMYREFATLSLKVDSQEKQIEKLMSEVEEYKKLYANLQVELEEHYKTRGVENAKLLERLKDLEYKVEVLSIKSTITKNSQVFNDRFVKSYFKALVKKQWGQNLIKFQGVKLPGGIELNGRQMYDDGQSEISEIREEMISTYEIPPLDMIA